MTFQTGFHKGGRNWSWSLTRVVARRASTVYSFDSEAHCLGGGGGKTRARAYISSE